MRVVRNGRMSLEIAWRREEGIGSRGQVVAWLDITSLQTSSEERGVEQVRPTKGGVRRRGWGSDTGQRGADVLNLFSRGRGILIRRLLTPWLSEVAMEYITYPQVEEKKTLLEVTL